MLSSLKPGRVVIVSPVYNGELYIKKCMESVKNQTYSNILHIVVNDGSTDRTLNVIQETVHRGVRLIHKGTRKGGLHSHIYSMKYGGLTPSDIIVHLDGDDYFIDNDAVQDIVDKYKSTGCLATYGNYKCTSPSPASRCLPFSESCGNFRQQILHNWCFSAPRTFYKHLWDCIKVSDFFSVDGTLFDSACDVVIFVPILEMAGEKRVEFIEKPIMMYNVDNPLNDSKVSLQIQVKCALEVAQMPEYEEI